MDDGDDQDRSVSSGRAGGVAGGGGRDGGQPVALDPGLLPRAVQERSAATTTTSLIISRRGQFASVANN